MRVLVASPAALLLSGCWLGEDFYAATELRAVVPPGIYIADRGPDRRSVTFRVSRLDDRLVSVRWRAGPDPENPGEYRVGFIPLTGHSDLFIVRINGPGTEARYKYDLLRREPDGSFRFYEPACVPDEEMARAAGADTPFGGGCIFPTRAVLERGLADFADQLDHRDHLHFVRRPNG